MNKKEFGKKVKLARVELNLTQTDLAKKIDSKQKFISRYENGFSLPSLETLIKISKALRKNTGYFLDGLVQ